MPEAITQTLQSFYNHNWPLVIFGGLSLFFLFFLMVKPSRSNVLLFLGFLLLTLGFEYDKHLFTKIKSDMLDLMFPPEARFTKYSIIRIFLGRILPVFMNFTGWAMVVLGGLAKIFAGKTWGEN